MSDVILNSFQEFINRVIGKLDIKTTGDRFNDNVLVDVNIQVCTRLSLPIAQSLSIPEKTSEVHFILNLIRNELLKGNLADIHISDMSVCDLLRWAYISPDDRRNCSEYNPVYGECSNEYKFPRY